MKILSLNFKTIFSLAIILFAAGCAKEPDTLQLVSALEVSQRQKQLEEQAAQKAAAAKAEGNVANEESPAAASAEEVNTLAV